MKPQVVMTPVVAILFAMAGCRAMEMVDARQAPPQPARTIRAMLPAAAGPFAPSLVRVDGKLDGRTLAKDVERCEPCHEDVVRQWETSVHGNAALDDPSYLAVFDRFRATAGKRASRFCAGCHTPGLLIDGAVDAPIRADDPRAHAAITCEICHRVSSVGADGNSSFVLHSKKVPAPDKKKPGSLAQHIAGFSMRTLDEGELCAACHRGFLHKRLGVKHFMHGGDNVTPLASSGYAGSRLSRVDTKVKAASCISCHMPKERALKGDRAAKDGKVSSHRFIGARSWLAAMRNDSEHLELVRKFLRDRISLDVAAVQLADGTRVMPANGAAVTPGKRLVFDVVLRNLGVGHLFPGASLDVQDTWIQVEVADAKGRVLAEAGGQHAKTGKDPTAHLLKAIIADAKGEQLHQRQFERFDTVVRNNAIAPRDAVVVRYAFLAPVALARKQLPLKVSVRLRHRSATLPLQRLACKVSRTPRGRAMLSAGKRFGIKPLDPCPPQPILDIAETFIFIGAGSAARPRVKGELPAWRRLYEHGMALTHHIQESVGQARLSLRRSLAALDKLAPTKQTALYRAMVQATFARVALRQGRTKEALAWLDKANKGAPNHPALAALRGETLSRVWRWKEAVVPLRIAAAAAPKDIRAWIRLAIALGSTGDDYAALIAAQRGLALWPPQPDLLRVQALSLRSLKHPDAEVAMKTYLEYRGADNPSATRLACMRRDPKCALERMPVHTHEMRTTSR